jgi:DHA1 family inner membrane transport protein
VLPYLLSLALGTFAIGTGTYVFTGVLGPLATDLGVTLGAAGQVATVFALTYALTSPFLVTFTARAGRRRLMVGMLLLFALANFAAALAPGFALLLAARLVGAAAAGVFMPVASATAGGLAPPEKRGAALATVMSGLILSFVIGIPIGTIMGDELGWRATFWFAGALGLAAAAAVAVFVPSVPTPAGRGLRALTIVARPAVAQVLALTAIAFAAMFVVIGYIAPLVETLTGLTGRSVGILQSSVGVGSLVGAALGGAVADRGVSTRTLSALLGMIALGLAPFSLIAAFGTPGSALTLAAVVGTLLIGNAALFALVPIQQYRIIGLARDEAYTALSLNGAAIFLGQGLGAALGGAAIGSAGVPALGWVAALCVLPGLGIVAWSDRARALAPAPTTMAPSLSPVPVGEE